MKRPAFQFYPDKWQSDKDLRRCSIGARGLWVELCCVMHTCEPYGHLTEKDGSPMDDPGAAQLCALDLKLYRSLLAELERRGVPSRTASGVIYSRRMIRDEELRNIRAEGGKSGAEHGIKGAEFGSKGGRPRTLTGVLEPPLDKAIQPPIKPPPVFASAFASSSSSPSLKPAVVVTPPVTHSANNGNENKHAKVQDWSSLVWVTATANTLGMQRRTGEDDTGFMDRIHSAVNARMAQAKAGQSK